MAQRRSILSAVREEKTTISEPAAVPPLPAAEPIARKVKPSRIGKKHIGGYYDPKDPAVIAFQKLGIDLDKDQQEMLH